MLSIFGVVLSAGFGLLDYLFCLFSLLPQSSRYKFFSGGYGKIESIYHYRDGFLRDLKKGIRKYLKSGDIVWVEQSSLSASTDTETVQEGLFESPLSQFLPAESKMARFYFVKPTVPRKDSVCVIMLPATGEMGKSNRLTMARSLAEQYGWSSIILTAAFYGKRKPSAQRLFLLDTVGDMLLQSQAIIEESALLADYFINEHGPQSYVCFTGFSYGAAMASCGAALALRMGLDGRQIACAPYVGSASPVVMADGLMQTRVDYVALRKSGSSEPLSVTTQHLYDELNKTQLSVIYGPGDDKKDGNSSTEEKNKLSVVKLYASKHDAFVRPKYSLELEAQLSAMTFTSNPPKIKWLWGGHWTAAIVRRYFHKELVVDTVQELLDKRS